MKVLHAIHSTDQEKGGPSVYLQLLVSRLVRKMEVEVATLASPKPIALEEGVKTFYAQQSWLGLFGYSKEFKAHFETTKADVFHGNGLWQYPVHALAKAAKRRAIPWVLSTHGMLEPWSMTQGAWKKKAAMGLFQKRDLEATDVIHCTARMEADTVREMGYTNPIAVIPNGIDHEAFVPDSAVPKKKKLLFLSRIHHKKGLEGLIRVWADLPKELKKGWSVDLAGNGDPEYIASLQQLINEKGMQEEIILSGPVFGEEKVRKYQEASLFILPTFSENFGIVVAEALACGVPVITTQGAPWQDLEEYGCGWWTAVRAENIRAALEKALSKSESELAVMGRKGRKLVEEKYSIAAVADQMYQLYSWLVKGGEQPEFVV